MLVYFCIQIIDKLVQILMPEVFYNVKHSIVELNQKSGIGTIINF